MDNPKINLWNPLLTAEAKDVYEHLTNAENNRLWEVARKWGSITGVVVALISFFILSYLEDQVPALSFCAIVIPLAVLAFWIGFAPIRKRVKQILCETEYAKQKGFTSDNFRLFIFER